MTVNSVAIAPDAASAVVANAAASAAPQINFLIRFSHIPDVA
jgi:hypothetical protein